MHETAHIHKIISFSWHRDYIKYHKDILFYTENVI